ncbi:Os06g0669200 [Oryza sativa Japonica Group]|uniref:Os06g0669200 protein n=1 Tax=Oryza sativa subsp. japonica TaxID=39947 RepID=Q655S4_ORYSJ|nr:unknown protein [Oryza sativa Japonica Group]BAD45443.1 unknown protein [Oryza sativa Japonica Group]BAH93676.1 Os06g0669200 [Oryza sativa Japonica Group]|eukprot:NP_001174948.1 Os06g0669200 [Oryza sativa Japonica Group]
MRALRLSPSRRGRRRRSWRRPGASNGCLPVDSRVVDADEEESIPSFAVAAGWLLVLLARDVASMERPPPHCGRRRQPSQRRSPPLPRRPGGLLPSRRTVCPEKRRKKKRRERV